MSTEDTYGPGTYIGDAAKRLLAEARAKGLRQEGSFNGSPLIAYPNDTEGHVLERWDYERRLIQQARR